MRDPLWKSSGKVFFCNLSISVPFRNAPEISSYNAGVTLCNAERYADGADFFRKSIDYVVRNPCFRIADAGVR